MSTVQHHLPGDIERTSLAIIAQELAARGVTVPPEQEAVVRRVIHATADFDYAETLRFTPGAAAKGAEALAAGGVIVTDTNMALAGVSKPTLAKLGGAAYCYMSDPVFAIGNAPTALLALCDLIRQGRVDPALVIGVPVGFVNVVESKERLMAVCQCLGVPAIAAMGRKGGSSVAAAICNALLYTAAGQLDPAARGW